jgi:Na+-translocating ferredoxin:NAD+ oxidoreductase RnfE subunit
VQSLISAWTHLLRSCMSVFVPWTTHLSIDHQCLGSSFGFTQWLGMSCWAGWLCSCSCSTLTVVQSLISAWTHLLRSCMSVFVPWMPHQSIDKQW